MAAEAHTRLLASCAGPGEARDSPGLLCPQATDAGLQVTEKERLPQAQPQAPGEGTTEESENEVRQQRIGLGPYIVLTSEGSHPAPKQNQFLIIDGRIQK